MRLWGLAFGTALLSGCSFAGGPGGGFGGSGQWGAKAPQGAPYGAPQGFADPCQVPHAQAPAPRGCHPSQVSIGTRGAAPGNFGGTLGGNYAGGFPQSPQFGPSYTDAGYGSHAGGNAHTAGLRGSSKPRLRKPRFRGALDLGTEKSVSGSLIEFDRLGPNDPIAGYNPYDYQVTDTRGTRINGAETVTRFFADSSGQTRPRLDTLGNPYMIQDPNNPGDPNAMIADASYASLSDQRPYDQLTAPTISFDDVWSAPVTVGLSGEYIMSDRATVFGRVGYATSTGSDNGTASISGTLYSETSTTVYDANSNPIADPVSALSSAPGQRLASFAYDFSDLRRIDLEAGGRLYLDPLSTSPDGRTVTPFVGLSAGASHYNTLSYKVDQQQRNFDTGTTTVLDTVNVDVAEAQWVPTGRLSVGAEWQVTPKTALAFETGLKIDGKRDFVGGTSTDNNISVPVTLRGSFNF